MRENTRKSLSRVCKKGFDFIAEGTFVTLVPPRVVKAISGATDDSPVVVSSSGHGFNANALVTIADVAGNTAANGLRRVMTPTTNSFALFTSDGQEVEGNGEYEASTGTATLSPVSVQTARWSDISARAEGVEIFYGGIEEEENRLLLFLNQYLRDQGIVDLSPEWQFLIDGERWDYRPGMPIADKTGASDGTDNLTWIVVRKAVELEHTQAGADLGFDLTGT